MSKQFNNVFNLFQNTGRNNQVQVDITAGFYDTTPQHTADMIRRMEQQFKDTPPFDAQAFIAAARQKLKEPGQAVIVIDSFSPMATWSAWESSGMSYVQKPKVGRMSSNVKVFGDHNELVHESEGPYTDDCVFQAYCPPGQVEGRNNFIIGMFMVPDAVEDRDDMFDSTAATLCIREFESPTLSWKNERFIPHIIV